MSANKKHPVRKKDLTRTRGYGRSYFSGTVELRINENKQPETKIGCIIGLQFSKKATERNKAKRWARETLHKHLPKSEKNKNILVIIRKKQAEKTGKNYIQENVKEALEKAGIKLK